MCLLCVCVLPASLLALFSVETCWCSGCPLTFTWVKTWIFGVNIKMQYSKIHLYLGHFSVICLHRVQHVLLSKGSETLLKLCSSHEMFLRLVATSRGVSVWVRRCAQAGWFTAHSCMCCGRQSCRGFFSCFFFSLTSLCVCVCLLWDF